MLPSSDSLDFANEDEADAYKDGAEELGADSFEIVKALLRPKHFVRFINNIHKCCPDSVFIFDTQEQAQYFIECVLSAYNGNHDIICMPITFADFKNDVKRTGYRFLSFEYKYHGVFDCIEQSPAHSVFQIAV